MGHTPKIGGMPASQRIEVDDSTPATFNYAGDSVLPKEPVASLRHRIVAMCEGKGGSDWPRWDMYNVMSTDVIKFELSTAHPHYLTHPPGFRLEIWQAEELP